LTFDADAAARLRRTYATTDAVDVRRRIRARLAPLAGERFVDIGCGPGHLAVELAIDVGPTGMVFALDPYTAMLEIAREEVEARSLGDRVEVVPGDAMALPMADASVDGIAIVQVLEHLAAPEGALVEAHRVLRPGGRLVVVDTDWRSCVWRTEDPDRTDRVVRAWRGRFAHPDLPGRLRGLLCRAGFEQISVEAVSILNLDTEQDTFSMGMLGALVSNAAAVADLGPEVAEAWRTDVLRQAESDEYFFSLTRFLFHAHR
jgi:arsenite methyltransferase